MNKDKKEEEIEFKIKEFLGPCLHKILYMYISFFKILPSLFFKTLTHESGGGVFIFATIIGSIISIGVTTALFAGAKYTLLAMIILFIISMPVCIVKQNYIKKEKQPVIDEIKELSKKLHKLINDYIIQNNIQKEYKRYKLKYNSSTKKFEEVKDYYEKSTKLIDKSCIEKSKNETSNRLDLSQKVNPVKGSVPDSLTERSYEDTLKDKLKYPFECTFNIGLYEILLKINELLEVIVNDQYKNEDNFYYGFYKKNDLINSTYDIYIDILDKIIHQLTLYENMFTLFINKNNVHKNINTNLKFDSSEFFNLDDNMRENIGSIAKMFSDENDKTAKSLNILNTIVQNKSYLNKLSNLTLEDFENNLSNLTPKDLNNLKTADDNTILNALLKKSSNSSNISDTSLTLSDCNNIKTINNIENIIVNTDYKSFIENLAKNIKIDVYKLNKNPENIKVQILNIIRKDIKLQTFLCTIKDEINSNNIMSIINKYYINVIKNI